MQDIFSTLTNIVIHIQNNVDDQLEDQLENQLEDYEITSESSKGSMDLLMSNGLDYLENIEIKTSLNTQDQNHDVQSDSSNILIRSRKSSFNTFDSISSINDINNDNDWLEKSIVNEYIKLYEYLDFKNFQSIKKGSFGSIVRATLKNTDDLFALKSFNNDEGTLCKIVREVFIKALITSVYSTYSKASIFNFILSQIKLHQVIAHENIIQFYGITKMENGTIKNHH
jgi:hypothetical protein